MSAEAVVRRCCWKSVFLKMHHYSQEKPLLESLSLTFSSWFFVFSFLTNWKKSIVAFISTFRSRHWELLCKTAARQDISKIDMFFLTKLELVFSIVYERKFINILKNKTLRRYSSRVMVKNFILQVYRTTAFLAQLWMAASD